MPETVRSRSGPSRTSVSTSRAPATDDYTPIIQYTCTGADNQRFKVAAVANGQVEVRTFAGKCLDVKAASPDDYTSIIQYSCTSAYNQRFWID